MSIKHLTGRTKEEVERIDSQRISHLEPKKYYKYLGKVFLMNIDVTYNGEKVKKKNVLYFFNENTCIFKYFIFENHLELSYIFLVLHDMWGGESKNSFWRYLTECTNVRYLISDYDLNDYLQANNIQINENMSFRLKDSFDWRGIADASIYKILRD